MAEESAEVEAAEDNPSVENLAKLSDNELATLFGLTKQLEDIKKAIKEMQTLTGKAREYAEERIENMLTPHIYPGDVKYIVEDAKRSVKKDAKTEMCNCSPDSVL